MLDERLGKLHFWLVFIGFNLTFFPQHMLGLLGMPRRVYTYHAGGLWEVYNMISSIGSAVMTAGMLVFVVNVVQTFRVGRRADNDPWLADTLEWYTTSPPPAWNFDRLPYVTSARPLRDLRRRLAESRAPPDGSLGAPHRARGGRRHRPRGRLGRRGLGNGSPGARRPSRCRPSPPSPRSRGSRLAASCPVALTALALFGLAALLTGDGVHLAAASGALAVTVLAAARTFRGVEPATGGAARLHHADQAADHVAAPADGRRRRSSSEPAECRAPGPRS